MVVNPGYMVPPHVHSGADEWSNVLHGRIGARVGDDECEFWNAGPERARIIELLTPGAFEHMFRRMADLAAATR